ncbi:MAG: hypothetical protein JJE51_13910 [Thermoanaerobaculia bacterium]|nr:hypothetical protein [Thermoanaerobaculia bacterium]
MNSILWTLSSLLVIGLGLPALRFSAVRDLDPLARLAIAFVSGTLFIGIVLYLEALAGIRWSYLSIGIPLLMVTVAFGRRLRAAAARVQPPWELFAVVFLCGYGAYTARITCADLLFFWGPKSQRFFLARGIDYSFLGAPEHFLMHADYPPLQPLVNAFSSLVTGSFSYEGAVLITTGYLMATALVFRGFSMKVIGIRKANLFSALLAAVLTVGFAGGRAAGGADPMLLMFEVLALAAATFSRERGWEWVVAIGLAGAAFTKVEGLTFVITLVLLLAIQRRQIRAVVITLVPAVVLIGSWIVVTRSHGLIDSYRRSEGALYPTNTLLVFRILGSTASYGAAHLPWIAALAPMALGRSARRALLPALAGLASIALAVFFYLHGPSPEFWIRSSAERVLLTALASFVVASAAASE